MNDKAIVLTSFGTTLTEERKRTLKHMQRLAQQAYPDWDVYIAFTSRIVIDRISKQEGEKFYSERAMFYHLASEGYREVAYQPLHIIPGAEYSKVMQLVYKWKADLVFRRLVIGRPLLYFIGQQGERPDDYQLLLETLKDAIPSAPQEGLLLLAHGTNHPAQAVYSALQLKANQLGYDNVWIGTLEGFPEWREAAKQMRFAGIRKIHVKPLFFHAGEHVSVDIFSKEEESVVQKLAEYGFIVEEDWQPLGQIEDILKLYMQHLDDAIGERYRGRSHGRPAIPSII